MDSHIRKVPLILVSIAVLYLLGMVGFLVYQYNTAGVVTYNTSPSPSSSFHPPRPSTPTAAEIRQYIAMSTSTASTTIKTSIQKFINTKVKIPDSRKQEIQNFITYGTTTKPN